jgi:hypothetical protein
MVGAAVAFDEANSTFHFVSCHNCFRKKICDGGRIKEGKRFPSTRFKYRRSPICLYRLLTNWNAFFHLLQDRHHGKRCHGVDGSFGVEEGLCVWSLHGLVFLPMLCFLNLSPGCVIPATDPVAPCNQAR